MSSPRFSLDALGRAMTEIIDYADEQDWDDEPIVFALVPTPVLAKMQPDVVPPDDTSELSPVQQETAELDRFLATATWPDMVVGAMVVTLITVVPPAEGEPAVARSGIEPRDGGPLDPEQIKSHPDARAARLAVGVLRDGPRLALMRVRGDDELRTHPDLAADLVEALASTFEPDER